MFKSNYTPEMREKRSTLALKTSFHLINVVLIGLCKVFKSIQEGPIINILLEDPSSQAKEKVPHSINLQQVMSELGNLCFYDVGQDSRHNLEIVEHAPEVFSQIRAQYRVTTDFLF